MLFRILLVTLIVALPISAAPNLPAKLGPGEPTLADIAAKLDTITARLDNIDRRLGDLETRVSGLETMARGGGLSNRTDPSPSSCYPPAPAYLPGTSPGGAVMTGYGAGSCVPAAGYYATVPTVNYSYSGPPAVPRRGGILSGLLGGLCGGGG